jgi:hypothetical protein
MNERKCAEADSPPVDPEEEPDPEECDPRVRCECAPSERVGAPTLPRELVAATSAICFGAVNMCVEYATFVVRISASVRTRERLELLMPVDRCAAPAHRRRRLAPRNIAREGRRREARDERSTRGGNGTQGDAPEITLDAPSSTGSNRQATVYVIILNHDRCEYDAIWSDAFVRTCASTSVRGAFECIGTSRPINTRAHKRGCTCAHVRVRQMRGNRVH